MLIYQKKERLFYNIYCFTVFLVLQYLLFYNILRLYFSYDQVRTQRGTDPNEEQSSHHATLLGEKLLGLVRSVCGQGRSYRMGEHHPPHND